MGGRASHAGRLPQDSAERRGQPSAGHRPGVVPRQFSAAAGAGDADFREYVNSRGRALLRSAYLLTGNLADAEDLVQSALAKTYQAWDRIEDRAAIDGYVRRAIVNTHISWWRRRKVDEYPTDEIPDQPVADTSADSELRDMLKRAIDRLPQRMRAAVVLRFFEDMTEAEVAEVLGVSQGTVKSTVSRAVAKLRADRDLLAESTAIYTQGQTGDNGAVPGLTGDVSPATWEYPLSGPGGHDRGATARGAVFAGGWPCAAR